MNDESNLTEMENLFLALSDKTRLRLLNLMRVGKVCVQDLTEVLNESQPKISRHLACLRNASIVSAAREGKKINYQIEFSPNQFAAKLLTDTLQWLYSQNNMRNDLHKLGELRGEETENIPQDIYAEAHTSKRERQELAVFLL